MHPKNAIMAKIKSKLNENFRSRSSWKAYIFQLMIGGSIIISPAVAQHAVRSGIDLAPFFENDNLVVIVKNSQGIEIPIDSEDVKKVFYKDAQTGLIQPINGNKLPNGYSQFAIDFIAVGPSASSGSAIFQGSGPDGRSGQMQIQFNPAQVPSSGTLVIDYSNLKSQFDRLGSQVINGNYNGQNIQFTLNPDGSISSSNGFIFYPDGRVVNGNGQAGRFEVQYSNPGLGSGDLSTYQKIQAIMGSLYGNGSGSGSFQFQGTAPAQPGASGSFGFNGQIPQNQNPNGGFNVTGQVPAGNGSGGSLQIQTAPVQQPGGVQGSYDLSASNSNLPAGRYEFNIEGSDIQSILSQLHVQIDGIQFSQDPKENGRLKLQAMNYFNYRLGYHKIDQSKIKTRTTVFK